MAKIILGRNRLSSYTVNFENSKIKWAGMKGNIINKREVSPELFDFLQSSTSAFQDGELVLFAEKKEDKEVIDELIENIPDSDLYKANTHTKVEIIKLLEGNTNKMKAELEKVTSTSEKRFVIDIAKELVTEDKLDSTAKRKFLVEWYGSKLSVEDFFEI